MSINSLQEAQILVVLHAARLDIIRLMKTLFLYWYRNGQPKDGHFHFEPYIYGPCAFDLYTTLEDMQRKGLITYDRSFKNRWPQYYLTGRGEEEVMKLPSHQQSKRLENLARWAEKQSFKSLLNKVYNEAPEYATRSIFRQKPSVISSIAGMLDIGAVSEDARDYVSNDPWADNMRAISENFEAIGEDILFTIERFNNEYK